MPSTLDFLLLANEDALTNHFQTIIPVFPNVLSIENLNLRVLTVEIPAQTISTYTITKRGRTATRPSGVSEQGNEFTFTYRSDKYFGCYNSISQWLSFIQNPSSMAMASDSGIAGIGGLSTFRVPVIVQGLDTSDIITNTWSFLGCYPVSQDAVSFDEGTGDPLEVSVTMNYTTMIYPGMLP
jgi:hypothetical protein